MSKNMIQKLIVSNVRTCQNAFSKMTIEFIRLFSDETKKSGRKKSKRAVYTPENPVSNEYTPDNPVSVENISTNPEYLPTNLECNPDDPNCISNTSKVEHTTANPEYVLEDSESTNFHSESTKPASIDNPPTTCCMSGCSNCVYISWAEALSKQMAGADPEVAKKILEKVQDPAMKSFLQMELRNLGIMK